MSEHKHEWELAYNMISNEIFGTCQVCLDDIDLKEIERRLNATECLSAEDARTVRKYVPSFKGEAFMVLNKAVLDYALILEGQND